MVILIGGGKRPQTDRVFSFIKNSKENSKVLYIPFARQDLLGCIEFIQNELVEISLPQNIFIPEIKKYQKDDFDDFDIMYIGGGDIFRLQTFIVSTGFDKVIRHWVETNKIVIGSSAGAIILGKDIKMHRKVPVTFSGSFNGLNLADDWSVVCHYIEEGYYKEYSASSIKQAIDKYVNLTESKVLGIPEDGAVIIEKKIYILCGKVESFGGKL